MKPELPFVLKILKEACLCYDYSFEVFDQSANNIAKVSNDKKHFYSSDRFSGLFPLNLNVASALSEDKYWTNKILQKEGYKALQSKRIYLSLGGENRLQKAIGEAISYAKNKYPVFVKPNNARAGLFADRVESEKELERILRQINSVSDIALIQDIINLPEYRIFAIDGKVKFLYKRALPELRGDGKKTVADLLEDFNGQIIKKENKIKKNSNFLISEMKSRGLNMGSVLACEEALKISPKSNLAAGGSIDDYSDISSPALNSWVEGLMKALCLRVCGVDVFVCGDSADPKNYCVIEVNQYPGLSGIYRAGYKKKAIEVWGEILQKYFK